MTTNKLDQELDDLFASPQKTIAQERRDARKAATRSGVRKVTSSKRQRSFGAWAVGTKYEQYYNGLHALARGGVHKTGFRKGKRKKRKEEDAEQIASIRWFTAIYPDYALCLHASAGGVFASEKAKARMGEMGYRVGTPDLLLAVPAWGKPGAFVEMKKEHGGSLSAEQKTMIAALKAQGYEVRVCHGFKEFSAFVEWWMGGVGR